MRVIYDGSFEGFLTLIYEIYYKKITPTSISKELPNELLLYDVHTIETNQGEATKVYEALKKKLHKENFQTILNIFMCEAIAFEMDLMAFIVEGFKSERNLQNINNPAIFNIRSYEKKLFHHVHKMTGFLRFVELEDGSLYAKLESRFNLVYFLGRHFSKRLNNQTYYIHDIARSLVFVHSKEFVGVREVAAFTLPEYSEHEAKFQKLWKEFFQSVTIQSRKNEKLQKQTVPLLFRTYMSEFEG